MFIYLLNNVSYIVNINICYILSLKSKINTFETFGIHIYIYIYIYIIAIILNFNFGIVGNITHLIRLL